MAQNNLPTKILVVDDDPTVAQSLEGQLAKYQINLLKASDLQSALYLYNQTRLDVVLVELEFAPLPGLALIQKWRNHEVFEKRCTGFVIMSGQKRNASDEALLKELGEIDIVNKPFSIPQILPYLSRALSTKHRTVQFHETKSKVLGNYEKTGDYAKAAEKIKENLQNLGPKGLDLLYEAYEKGGKFGDALSLITSMLQKDQNNISLMNAKGRLLMKLKRFNEAKEIFEKADKLAPMNIERINDMATMYLHLKDPKSSVDRFKQLLKLSPENPESKFEMFAKLYDFGYDEHAQQFGKETTNPMEIVRHYNNKGVLLSKEGNVEGALSEYERAIKFYPKFKENYRILYNIALAMANKKQHEEARKFLTQCLELKPDFEKAQKMLEILNKSGNTPKAS